MGMSKMKVKTSKEPASVSREAVKAAVEAMYGKDADNIVYEPVSPEVVVRVTKKTSAAKAKK